MASDFEGFYFFVLSKILRKSQYFPFNVESLAGELLVPFLKLLWYEAVLEWGLNLGPPALDTSTLGGGIP